ncbi:hypothetical protein MUG78_17020 [Gordonia alkaliphila]|uniref:hypothetical protein n=1 Tax=Gordonia alkaliphila TaxID=1053547 RepID=UPI001FF52F5D|nr:hypothetical protein [Gordonia alkaliphila]MCK0441103.1 hypothetical protein [Gordonia alkaliphila]
MVVSFNVGELNQHITGVGEVADTCIDRGQKLPGAIEAATAPIDVVDIEMAGDLQRVKAALGGQAQTLGAMYTALGGRVDTMAQQLGQYRDQALAVTQVGADGVAKITSGADAAKAAKGLGGLTDKAKESAPSKNPVPKGHFLEGSAALLLGAQGGEAPAKPQQEVPSLAPSGTYGMKKSPVGGDGPPAGQ